MRATLVLAVWWLAMAFLALPAAAADDVQAELAQVKQALAQLQRQSARPTGKDLYDALCATCHGTAGNGIGPAAASFKQRATDFTQGVYKLRSTLAKTVLPGDLERSIRDGMPGTEMVPFRGILSEGSIASVATYIRALTSKPVDPALEEEAIQQRVEVPAQRPFPATAESIEKGQHLYADRCLECHGESGEGSAKEKDDWGFPVHMLDFRGGVFKAGVTDGDLYRAILTGMNGTSMGGYQGDLSPDDVWNVVDYIRTLEKKPRGPIARLWNYFLVERPSGFNYGSR